MLEKLLFLALATYAASITVSKSLIFERFREWIATKNDFLYNLVSCPYCFSHWVAMFLVVGDGFMSSPFSVIVNWLAVIGLANLFSYIWLRLSRG